MSRCSLAAHNHSGIDYLAGPGDRPEIQMVIDDFRDQEGIISIESFRGKRRPTIDVPDRELSARADYEVRNPLLWLDALVKMIVTGEHHAHVVPGEERLQRFPQSDV